MNEKPVFRDVVSQCGCDKIIPVAAVYVFYLILHGHLSPGGGFQGGVLMVAIVALVFMGHGYERTVRTFSFRLLHGAEGLASIFYVGLGLMGVAVGSHFAQNFLYNHGNIGELYSSGTIFWMNVLVGVKVITGVGSIGVLLVGVLGNDNEREVK